MLPKATCDKRPSPDTGAFANSQGKAVDCWRPTNVVALKEKNVWKTYWYIFVYCDVLYAFFAEDMCV
jgi:hypothetical protein